MLNRLHFDEETDDRARARCEPLPEASGWSLPATSPSPPPRPSSASPKSRLGLTPATISPYVIAAMGERYAHRYFLSAERFTAAEAYRIGLVQEIAPPAELDATVNAILGELVQCAPGAQAATKALIDAVAGRTIGPELMADMATRIATARASDEGREGVRAFLEKRTPSWQRAAKRATRKGPRARK